jgi:hypothetical protein
MPQYMHSLLVVVQVGKSIQDICSVSDVLCPR